jgi:hypothetical protein
MKAKLCQIIVFIGIIVTPAGQVVAQGADDKLASRVQALEKIVSRLPGISGLVNLRYQYSDATGNESSSFDVRRARLDFKGNHSLFDYRLQVELAGTPKILDAYLVWKALPCLNVQAGEFKIPFSLENPYGPTTLETIDNSMVISMLSGYSDLSGISANGRDIGLAVNGGFFSRAGYRVVNYNLGIFNGSGINRADNNQAKDFSGILTVNPFKELSIAAYYYNGSTSSNVRDRKRAGIGVKYASDKLLVRGEYIQGKTGTLESSGYYVVAGYVVCPGLQPVLKIDSFRQDLDNKDSNRVCYTIGVNYLPARNLRLMLNYNYREEAGNGNYNHLAAQVMVSF